MVLQSPLPPSQPFSIIVPMYTLSGAIDFFYSFLTLIKKNSMFNRIPLIRFPAGAILSCQTPPSATAGSTGQQLINY